MADQSAEDDAGDTERPPVDDAESAPTEKPGDHLTDIPDGAGCTEIWEHLSTERDEER